jgi:chromosome segregation ATPase
MKDQLENYERQIELLKRGNSSSQPTYFSVELSKALSEINQKGFEIEKLKKIVSSHQEEIKTFQDQITDKDKVISEYQRIKSNLVADIEKLKHKKAGKAYLIGARHLIWDQIIT